MSRGDGLQGEYRFADGDDEAEDIGYGGGGGRQKYDDDDEDEGGWATHRETDDLWDSTEDLDEDEEGCLSLPGAFAPCARPDWARVEGVDQHGQPVEFEGDGILARCLQHETDHLYGRVFADRLSGRARRRLLKEAESLADQFPDDWPVTAAVPPEA